MSYKKFSQDLYNKYDSLGKKSAISFLINQGYTLINQDEAYKSHDFIVEKDGVQKRVEVQVCSSWNSKSFPYQSLNLPYRKRFTTSHLFIIVSNNGEALGVIPMSVMLSSPIITKNTCYTTDEKFFNASQSLARFFYFQNDTWCPVV